MRMQQFLTIVRTQNFSHCSLKKNHLRSSLQFHMWAPTPSGDSGLSTCTSEWFWCRSSWIKLRTRGLGSKAQIHIIGLCGLATSLTQFCFVFKIYSTSHRNLFFSFFFFCLFAISWAALLAYGGSQARGWVGAIAAGLCQSHSNVGSESCMQSTPQFRAVLDP